MLIILLRIAFVALATIAGHLIGPMFYDSMGMPGSFGASMGFAVAVTLIAAEHAFRRGFTRSLVAFLIGLGVGLALSVLATILIRLLAPDVKIANGLSLSISLVITYLVLITVLRNVDRWRLILPFVELRSERLDGGVLIIDPDMLGDSRLAPLLKSGYLAQRVLVHRAVVNHWEAEAAKEDAGSRARAVRALEGLKELRAMGLPTIDIDDTEIANQKDLFDVVIRLARLEGARLLSASRDLVRRAEVEGVPVIDLQALSQSLVQTIRPGDEMLVTVVKPGEGRDQGIGFLDDGGMVVVNGGSKKIGSPVKVIVLRTHVTSNGRMVFAEVRE